MPFDITSYELGRQAAGSGGGSGGGSPVTVEPIYITKDGDYYAPEGTAYSPVWVYTHSNTNPVAEEKDVNFIDYDGTIRYSYSAEEFAELDAMPPSLDHIEEGLVPQGWNWALEEAQEYVAKYGKLWIGHMFVTLSGNTEIDIVLEDGRLSPYLGIAVNGAVEIDWGDGEEPSTVTGTSLTNKVRVQHVYATSGKYTIVLNVTSGKIAIIGSSSSNVGTYLLTNNTAVAYKDRVYQNTVQRIRIGENCNIGGHAFSNCGSLSTITIPESINSFGAYAFSECSSLKSITVPAGILGLDDHCLYYCSGLQSVSLPNGLSGLGNSAFAYCTSLSSMTTTGQDLGSRVFESARALRHIVLPSSVSGIPAFAFQNCVVLQDIDIPDTVTYLGSSAMASCEALEGVAIPNGVNSLSSSVFYACYRVAKIAIPSSVTDIATQAFQNCYGLGEIRFESTTPPTVANSNAFYSLPTDCIIYVPAGSLEAYTSATNYPSSNTYTYVEY